MKTIITLILFCASPLAAEDTSTHVNESRNPDGILRWRVETTRRAKTPILLLFQTLKEGKTATTRSYMVDNQIVMVEADDDGDGHFETTLIFRPPTKNMEVFTRDPDGTPRPVSAQALAAYKRMHTAVDEFWSHPNNIFDKDADAEEFKERFEDMQKRIRDAEKEVKDEKK